MPRFGTDHQETWSAQKVSARDLTIEHLCRFTWHWGYVILTVTTPNRVADSLRFRHITDDMFGGQPLSMRLMFRRLHRLLLMDEVDLRLGANWSHLWRTQPSVWACLAWTWDFHVLCMHLWLNPQGNDCTCWRDPG